MTDDLTPYEHDRSARDGRGRFEPFLIPRPLMPQIREEDYTTLFAYLYENGVGVEREIFHPDELRLHQRMDRLKPRAMPLSVERVPVLISADLYVLDGNHRAEKHVEDGRLIDAWVVMTDFNRAVELLRAFPLSCRMDYEEDVK